MSVRILILNYNGKDLLEKYLASVMASAAASRHECHVTVVDNASRDDSVEWLRRNFPDVAIYESRVNKVLCAYNDAVKAVSEDIVLLLNNDIQTETDFVDPLMDVLAAHGDAFFAAPRVLHHANKSYEGSRSKMQLRWGLLWGTNFFKGYEVNILSPSLTMQCGFGAFRRDIFLALNGYDDLYLPGTVEDSDLCFRAYRKGWKGYYCPVSVVYHMGQETFKRFFGARGIQRINRRNLFLFMWKNIKSPFLLLKHLFCIPIHLLAYCVTGKLDLLMGFMDALKMMPEALDRRRRESRIVYPVAESTVFSYSRKL